MSTQPQPPGIRPSPLNGVIPPESGRFKPGVSGNKAGLPKSVAQARKLAANATPEIIQRMIALATDPETNGKVAVSAAALVLERGLGKAGAMRELYPQKNTEDDTQAGIGGLSDDQQRRIYQILREDAV